MTRSRLCAKNRSLKCRHMEFIELLDYMFFKHFLLCIHSEAKQRISSEHSSKYFAMKMLCEIREIQRRLEAFVVNKYVQGISRINCVLLYNGDASSRISRNTHRFLFEANPAKELLLLFIFCVFE